MGEKEPGKAGFSLSVFALKTAERLLFPWKKNGLDAAIEE